VTHLKKTYGNVKAVEDVSFVVNEGEIFGLLGPNGAGKTTTVECITGLRHPDGGTISVFGLDPQVDRDALHPVVGVQLQFSTFPDKLKVNEILDMYQSFYPNPANPEELVRALGFSEKLGSYYKTLSSVSEGQVDVLMGVCWSGGIKCSLSAACYGLWERTRWTSARYPSPHGPTVPNDYHERSMP
jgi:ABC-2 type transport system ATP-binding protein